MTPHPRRRMAGAGEFGFIVGNTAEVDAAHAAWRDEGFEIAQPPTAVDFGYTFVGLDPDRHRLRVFVPR